MIFFIDGNRDTASKIAEKLADLCGDKIKVNFLAKESDELISMLKTTTVFNMNLFLSKYDNIVKKLVDNKSINIVNFSRPLATKMMLNKVNKSGNDLAKDEVNKNFKFKTEIPHFTHTLVLESKTGDNDVDEGINGLIEKLDGIKAKNPKTANNIKDIQIVRDETLYTKETNELSEQALIKTARILYNKYLLNIEYNDRKNVKDVKKQEKLRRKKNIGKKKVFNKKNMKDSYKGKRREKDEKGNMKGHHSNSKEYKQNKNFKRDGNKKPYQPKNKNTYKK